MHLDVFAILYSSLTLAACLVIANCICSISCGISLFSLTKKLSIGLLGVKYEWSTVTASGFAGANV